ncbi:DUF1631 domain-containing protein [Pseudomonas putida]|uniref:Thymidine phosphorylase n=1 Tax=Pseudomonas putida TaxID=303 RepID=A0A1X0ZQ20_PSEPU|nr:DUF1631 domain-containing protein [Pseudomonas putida]ORL61100.1 thymidine phosphorylase [Pseudomonas putida]
MQIEGKVVPLAAAIDRGPRASLPCLPVPLLQVRDQAALHLRLALQTLFDNADDTLFEMADKASERFEQNLYFEAMRDLRLKRKNIERGFLDRFHDAFARLNQADERQSGVADRSRSTAQLERSAAVEAMVARVLSRDGQALKQLTLRFQVLLETPLAQRLALGPESLCDHFLQAGRDLGVGPKVKLVLLKLFERYVLREIDQLYEQANQLLANAGILPELKAAPRRRAEDHRHLERPATGLAKADEPQADDASQVFFDALTPLLAPLRGRVAPRVQQVPGAQPVSTTDLLRLLSHLQHYVPATCESDDFDLGQQLEQLLLRVSVRSGTRRCIATADEDTFNLVGLLFAFIQKDNNLPAAVRELIERLHIPLLKVALLDKAVFSRASHPARRLLNEIAAAAIGWETSNEGLHDSLQLRVERIVQRLLNEFTDDPRLFSELLEDFLAFSQQERRRNELLEQRTRDAEEGRARALQARLQVQQELNVRLHGRVLPQAVVHMLVQGWSQVLLLAWLKHGEGSAGWAEGLATMDALLASIAPHHEPSARERLLQQVPGLLKALREGLAGVVMDAVATREFFQQLEQLHLAACVGAPGSACAVEHVLVAEEVILAVADEPACGPLLQPDMQGPELAQVQRLKVGAWVEVMDDDELLRCKLVARIDNHDRFVFANRTGMKVREWNRAGLAQALRRGELRLLDDGLLFERALEAVLGRLRRQADR